MNLIGDHKAFSRLCYTRLLDPSRRDEPMVKVSVCDINPSMLRAGQARLDLRGETEAANRLVERTIIISMSPNFDIFVTQSAVIRCLFRGRRCREPSGLTHHIISYAYAQTELERAKGWDKYSLNNILKVCCNMSVHFLFPVIYFKFGDESVDAYTIAFGIRNVTTISKALRYLHSAL